jgi:hypothetical protein
MNTAAVAIELYLKCLSAEKAPVDAGGGWSRVSATAEHVHGLTTLLDKVEVDLRDELDRAFLAEFPASWGSFRDRTRDRRFPLQTVAGGREYGLIKAAVGCCGRRHR